MEQQSIEKEVHQVIVTRFQLIASVCGLLIPVMGAFSSIQTDIALIKQNHLTHIENIQREVADIKKREEIRDKALSDLVKTFIDNTGEINKAIGQLSR